MLECACIVLHVIVVVVRVGEEFVAACKDICRRHIRRGQAEACRMLDFVDLFRVIGKVLAKLVTQVRVGVLVAYDLYGLVDTYGSVVGGEDYLVAS